MKSSILKTLFVLLLSIIPYVGYAGGLGVMSYQGHLVDAANQPINGTINITFSIPGTTWTETYTNVQVNNGLFGVILGSQTSLTTVDWNQQRSLKLNYNGTSQTVPITGSPPLGDTLGNLNCTKDQIAKYNGTAWVCLDQKSLEGSPGPQGPPGKQGLPGRQGPAGPTKLPSNYFAFVKTGSDSTRCTNVSYSPACPSTHPNKIANWKDSKVRSGVMYCIRHSLCTK